MFAIFCMDLVMEKSLPWERAVLTWKKCPLYDHPKHYVGERVEQKGLVVRRLTPDQGSLFHLCCDFPKSLPVRSFKPFTCCNLDVGNSGRVFRIGCKEKYCKKECFNKSQFYTGIYLAEQSVLLRGFRKLLKVTENPKLAHCYCRTWHPLTGLKKHEVGACKAVLRMCGGVRNSDSSLLQMSWCGFQEAGGQKHMHYR